MNDRVMDLYVSCGMVTIRGTGREIPPQMTEGKACRKLLAFDELLAACNAAMPILLAYIHPDQFDGHAARALVKVRAAIEKAEKGGA